MRISVIANTNSNSESFGFLKPIADLDFVSRVIVFGEGCLQQDPKIEYIADKFSKPKIIKLILRQFEVIRKSRNCDYIIGIYEIPHGFIAFISGLILRKKTILCIIGNPAYSQIRKGFRLYLLNLMIKRMDATTITGSRSKKFLLQIGHVREKLFVLPNSIDISIFQNRGSSKKYDIISLGQLNPEKELINLLRVIIILKRSFINIKVGIAGRGPEYEKLNKFIKHNGLTENVSLLGFVENKVDFYCSGKIFLLTSSTEGLPRTVIESMSCGTPCIVSDVGDITDLILEGETGFLVNNFNDIEEYASKAAVMLNNEKIRNEISQNSMLYVREKYSHSAATMFWRSLFNKI